MRGICRKMIVVAACLALLCACNSKQEKGAMPFSKEDVSAYVKKTQIAVQGTPQKEFAESQKDLEKQKALMYKCIVQPMEDSGYSYDKTISELSTALLAHKLNFPDMQTSIALGSVLAFAKDNRDAEYKFGFITRETKDLLDKVSLILPG